MKRIAAVVWVLVFSLSVGFIIFKWTGGPPLKTDFLDLVEGGQTALWVEEAGNRLKQGLSERLWLLVGHDDLETGQKAAEALETSLLQTGILTKAPLSDGMEALATELFPHRASLLTAEDRHDLLQRDGEAVVTRALARILSPFGVSDSDLITKDPFLLFPTVLTAFDDGKKHIQRRGDQIWVEDTVKGRHYAVLTFILQGEGFDAQVQDTLIPALEDAELQAKSLTPDLEVLRFGAVFYAARGLKQGQGEASLFGGIALAGIILMTWLVFRGVRPLALNLMTIGSGIIVGVGATLLLFGEMHIMALVFGAGLIGIATDYTFHYCCEGLGSENTTVLARVHAVTPGLTMGMVSSCLGFLILAITPFPGLQQIAVFSAAGLFGAWLCVVGLYPVLDVCKVRKRPSLALRTASLSRYFWVTPSLRWVRIGLFSGLLVAMVAGASLIKTQDNVSALQSLPKDLRHEELRIVALTGMNTATQAFLISGETDDEALQVQEALLDSLTPLIEEGVLTGAQSLAQIVPSRERRTENFELIQWLLSQPTVTRWEALTGMPFQKEMYGPPDETFDLSTILSNPNLSAFRLGEGLHLMRLEGVTARARLATLAEQSENLYYLDTAFRINTLMAEYRYRALISLAFAIGVIGLFLTFRYGPKKASLALFPPVVAVILTPSLLALMGQDLSLINVMALILVLAIGLDFVLFRREAHAEAAERVDLANVLSALSSLMAFGLLAMSEMAALQSFGLTIAVGISLACFLAPLGAIDRYSKPDDFA